jgi:hypothetical protein
VEAAADDEKRIRENTERLDTEKNLFVKRRRSGNPSSRNKLSVG